MDHPSGVTLLLEVVFYVFQEVLYSVAKKITSPTTDNRGENGKNSKALFLIPKIESQAQASNCPVNKSEKMHPELAKAINIMRKAKKKYNRSKRLR